MHDSLYYCIIRNNNPTSSIDGSSPVVLSVVTMQDHDECDYDQSRFLCKKGTDKRHYFDSKEEAIQFLNDNIKPEFIDPEYLVLTQKYNDSFYKDE